jgi:ABC-type antimicrobial peptide transport system permease subunit
MILLTSFLVVLTGVFSAIYPALKAIKLDPAIATRNE